jgi:atypical dual specificity phosphatase
MIAEQRRSMEQPISESLWWLIPGQLAGVRKPNLEEISDLKVAGVYAVISVLDDPSNLNLYEQAKIPHLWLPTKGGTAPTREQVQELQTFVDEQNVLGNGVAVHCTNGKRRTGTMLAAYLISSGASYEDAVQMLHSANSEIELREAQADFLQGLANDMLQLEKP